MDRLASCGLRLNAGEPWRRQHLLILTERGWGLKSDSTYERSPCTRTPEQIHLFLRSQYYLAPGFSSRSPAA